MSDHNERQDAHASILIWDAEGTPPDGERTPVLWREFVSSAQPEAVSIPTLIETNADLLKKRYLAWVYELGEKSIQGKRLVEHLQLRPGFSYWWMTLFVEKSVYKSPITDVIRMLALEEIINQHKPIRIQLVSDNKILNRILCDLCHSLDIIYEWKHLPSKKILNFKSAYMPLLSGILPLISLARYVFFRWFFCVR